MKRGIGKLSIQQREAGTPDKHGVLRKLLAGRRLLVVEQSINRRSIKPILTSLDASADQIKHRISYLIRNGSS